MIELLLEMINLFGKKKLAKLSVFDKTIYITAEYGGKKYDIKVDMVPEDQDDVQV